MKLTAEKVRKKDYHFVFKSVKNIFFLFNSADWAMKLMLAVCSTTVTKQIGCRFMWSNRQAEKNNE